MLPLMPEVPDDAALAAFQAVQSGAHNANHWVVVASSHSAGPSWTGMGAPS